MAVPSIVLPDNAILPQTTIKDVVDFYCISSSFRGLDIFSVEWRPLSQERFDVSIADLSTADRLRERRQQYAEDGECKWLECRRHRCKSCVSIGIEDLEKKSE